MGGKLTDKGIESLCFGVIEVGKRKGQYRKYQLNGTEWNTDNEAMLDTKGKLKSKFADGGSMYLLLTKNGAKSWRMDYSFPKGGKRKTICFGVYPVVGIAEARAKQLEAKKLLSQGIDPMQERKDQKEAIEREQTRQRDTFEAVSMDWYESRTQQIKTRSEILRELKKYPFASFGNKPIADVTRQDVVELVKSIEKEGHTCVSHRVLQVTTRILDFALILKKVSENVALGLSKSLAPHKTEHHASIKDRETLGAFLRDCENADNFSFENKMYLLIAPYIFVRPIELAKMRWDEISFEKKLWAIPASKMKKKRDHLVPLSKQVIALLEQIKTVHGNKEYVFYSSHAKGGYITYKGVNKSIRSMKGSRHWTKDVICVHGLRGTASTMLHELGYPSEWVEKQLSHEDKNKTRASYNAAEYLEDRTRMMQEWADFLDKLKKQE